MARPQATRRGPRRSDSSNRPGSRRWRFAEFGEGLFHPTVRLGVTGLSRAGKTVFITALVHGLLRGGRFPVFEPLAGGRIAGRGWRRSPTTRCRVSTTSATCARS